VGCLAHKYVDDTTLTELISERTMLSNMQTIFEQLLTWADITTNACRSPSFPATTFLFDSYTTGYWIHFPCLAPLDYKEAVRPLHHLPLRTRHAVYKCRLHSWPAHHVRPQGPTCQKIIQIHNSIYQSISQLRVPTCNICLHIFAYIPTREPKNTNLSSPMLSPTIRLHNCCFIVFIVFFCVCFLHSIQPLATTVNKRYIWGNWINTTYHTKF